MLQINFLKYYSKRIWRTLPSPSNASSRTAPPPPLEALPRPTLSAYQWNDANSRFAAIFGAGERVALPAFFHKVLKRASEANSDSVMEEVA